jgi:hypothetical protein
MATSTTTPTFGTFQILFFAMFSTIFLYVGVAVVAAPELAVPPEPTMAFAFGIAALSCAVMSFLLPRRLLDTAYAAQRPEIRETAEAREDGLFRDEAVMRRAFADPAAVRRKLLQMHMTPFILGLALSESVVIFGLVLRFLGHSWAVALPFFVLGAVLMAARFPTMAGVEREAERRFDASFNA